MLLIIISFQLKPNLIINSLEDKGSFITKATMSNKNLGTNFSGKDHKVLKQGQYRELQTPPKHVITLLYLSQKMMR